MEVFVSHHWHFRPYEACKRFPGEAYDIVYHEGMEPIAFMILLLSRDGTLTFFSNNVYPSYENGYAKRNDLKLKENYAQIKAKLFEVGNKLVSGEEQPHILYKTLNV